MPIKVRSGGAWVQVAGDGADGSDGIPAGGIIIWSGASNAIPSGWVLCNGSNSTPDLRNRFVIGAGSGYAVNATGGSATKTLGTANLPSHTHTAGTLNAVSNGAHTHTYVDQYVVINNGYRPWPANNNDCAARNVDTGGNGAHTHALTGNTGDQCGTMAQSFSILPPYYALCYIMKT